jgi:transposase-like protein
MAKASVPSVAWLRKRIEEADPDLLREMVKGFAEILMSAEVDGLCGAAYGHRSEARSNHRNGYRGRRWDTRVGTIDLGIPKVRKGSYFPDWLLRPRRRAERALVQVVVESYVRGVSTRRVDGLVQSMGVEGMSKSQVSEMAKELDGLVEQFRSRLLDEGPYVYVWLDAMVQRCREGGRVVNVAVVIATGVNTEGRKVLLGFDIFTAEDEAAWTEFLRSLVERGLNGVLLVISDAHQGLKAAIAKALPGASWQRCRTHFARNLLSRVPRSAQDLVAAMNRSIFAQITAEEVRRQHGRVIKQLCERFPQAAELLEEAAEDILAFTAFPKEHWRQIWSNNPQERLIREIRRRTDVVSIFPNREAIIRLVGAVLAEQDDEWLCARRYMSLHSMKKIHMPQQIETGEQIKKLAA